MISFEEALEIAKKYNIHKEVELGHVSEYKDAYFFCPYEEENYFVDYVDDSFPIIVLKENGRIAHPMEYHFHENDPIREYNF